VIVGDNGASKEGTLNGDVDRSLIAKPLSEKDNIQYNLTKINDIGTPTPLKAIIRWDGPRRRIRRSGFGNPTPTAKAAPAIR
jgi:hypothetical protein